MARAACRIEWLQRSFSCISVSTMSVETILDYKVNEGDLKKWLGTEFGFVDGNPQFSYKVVFRLT